MDPTIPTQQTNNTTLNGRCEIFHPTIKLEKLLPEAVIVIIALIGLVGNGIFWLLGFQMQRNTFSVYILNLAGSDFLFLFVQFVYHLGILINGHVTSASINRLVIFVRNSAYLTSLSILNAISTERCLSVLRPFWYHNQCPKHFSAVMCAMLWALSLLLTVFNEKHCGILFGNYDRNMWRQVNIIIAFWLIFSCVLLSGSSLTLLIILLCGSQRIKLTRLYMTIGLAVLVFHLCGLPWGIHWFLLYWFLEKSKMFSLTFNRAIYVLTWINSCANPIIYFFVGFYRQKQSKQRWTLKFILQRALQDAPVVDKHESNPPLEISEISHMS